MQESPETEEIEGEKAEKAPKRRPPLIVNYTGGDRDETRYRLKQKLQQGIIPKVIIEGSRLVGAGEAPESDKVITYIKDILDKLSLATTGKPSPDMRVFLSDQEGINTGIITEAKPPILIVGLGMIDKITEHGYGEDHLAAILGHERLHYLRHEKWDDLGNGRPEETIGDVYGVMESTKAGYNPQALGSFFKALRDEQKGENNRYLKVSELLDEHPSIDDRIRNTELAIANLQLTRRLETEQTDIPADVIAAADNVKYEGLFDRYKRETNYDSLSPVEKFDLIAAYFRQELGKKELEKTRTRYIRQKGEAESKEAGEYIEYHVDGHLMAMRLFEAYVDLIKLQGEDGIKERAYKHLRDFMAIEHDRWQDRDAGTHYGWTLKVLIKMMMPKQEQDYDYREYYGGYTLERDDGYNRHNNTYDKILPPVLLRLKTDAEKFWTAQTKEDAVKAARNFEAAEHILEKYQNGIRTLNLLPSKLDWPGRSKIRAALQSGDTCRLKWENQVQWATSMQSTDEEKDLLKRVAIKLGCDDPRLTGKDIPDWRVRSHSEGGDLDFKHIHFDDIGNITALDYTEEEKMLVHQERFRAETAADLYEREYDLQKKREEKERNLVSHTDWQDMEKDFWGFVEKHHEHLEPSYSVVSGKFPFAEEFMSRLQKLADEKSGEWKKKYISFITGHDFDKTPKDRSYYGEEKCVRPYALPDLFVRAEKKYFGYGSHYDDFRREFRGKRGQLPSRHPMYGHLRSHHDKRRGEHCYRQDKKTGRLIEYDRNPKAVHHSQEDVEIPLKMDRSHPFARAILAYDGEYISPSRRANMISNFRFYNSDAKTLDSYYRISPRRVFHQASFNTAKAFDRYSDHLRYHETNKSPSWHWHHAQSIELLRTLRRFDRQKPEKRFSISQLPFWTATDTFDFYDNKELGETLYKELKKRVNNQVRRNRNIDFKKSVPLKTLIKRYIDDHGEQSRYGAEYSHDVFAFRPHLERSYQNHIRKRILALPLEERAAYLEQLMELQIKNPEYRDWAIDAWVESTSSSIGKDDGSDEYRKNTLKLLKDAIYNLDSAQGLNCVIRLLDKVEAQRDTALKAKEMLSDNYGRKFLEKDGAMRLIESAISTCANDPELRQAFLDYITEPLSAQGTKYFADILKQKAGQKYSGSDFVKQFFNPEKRISLAPLQEQTVVDYLHQNFWSMPFELRTVYLDRILFPVSEESEETFDKAVEFIFDKVLPLDKKFAAEAREALTVYLDCCPPELRRTTFSAILATTEQAAQKGEMRPGQVLSYVLTRTGAAGGQLLQAAHSYLSGIDISDPDMILFREDLKDSKADFDRPKRWEIFERMDEVLPEQMLEDMKAERIGPVLGSGSTAYVIAREKQDGESAIKLMRKDVVPIADLQFERYLSAFETLASRHDHYAPLPSMVENARKLIRVSADGQIARKQVDYAQKEYEPVKVMVNGRQHSFRIAKTISAGPEYLETERIYGNHLNDIAAGAEKTDKSIAIEAVEIYRLLRGKATDKDRHGGQQGISGDTIGMFDVGQIPFDLDNEKIAEPTANDKKALGQLLGIAFNAAASGKPMVETIVDAVAANDWGGAKAYLVDEQRSLLARMDVHNGFGQNEKERAAVLTQIFKTVWSTRQIDADIFRGITETIEPVTCYRLAKEAFNQSSEKCAVSITDGSDNLENTRLSPLSALRIIAGTAAKRTLSGLGISLDQ